MCQPPPHFLSGGACHLAAQGQSVLGPNAFDCSLVGLECQVFENNPVGWLEAAGFIIAWVAFWVSSSMEGRGLSLNGRSIMLWRDVWPSGFHQVRKAWIF